MGIDLERVIRQVLSAEEALEVADEIERLRTEIDWACERLEVDDGMTAKEQATTARRLRSALSVNQANEKDSQ